MATTIEEARANAEQIKYRHGDWCHHELPVKDLARAKKFYSEAFGWNFQDVPEMNYTLYITPGGFGGGFFTPDEQMPDKVVSYINVEDIEATRTKLESLGAKLLGPVVDIPGYGRMQHLLDTEGTLIALYQGSPEKQG